MKSRTLHISQLIASYACQPQVDLFREMFGDQVEVTVSLARKFGREFDIPFAANRLLSGSALVKYHAGYGSLMEKREALRAPIEARYKVECEPARMKHIATCESLSDALAKYNEECAPIWDDYMADRSALWADCYINDEVPK